jgi:hypothetical protein
MHVDAGLLSLAFSAVSTLVVVIGALVAVRQLRYMRSGNEMQTLETLTREWESPAMTADREFVRTELSAILTEPAFAEELRATPVGPRAQHVVRVANFYEKVAMYVKGGALSEELAVMIFGVSATGFWPIMRPAIAIRRSSIPYAVLNHFEDFALRAPEAIQAIQKRRLRRLRHDPAMDALVAEPRAALDTADGPSPHAFEPAEE